MKDKFYNLDDLPLMLRVDDLMVLMDVGRNMAYELLRCGRIRSVRIDQIAHREYDIHMNLSAW